MRRKIDQRNRAAIALWHLNAWRQIFTDGIVERNLAALHHIRKQHRGEYLCRRADLKNRVAVERARIAFLQVPVGD